MLINSSSHGGFNAAALFTENTAQCVQPVETQASRRMTKPGPGQPDISQMRMKILQSGKSPHEDAAIDRKSIRFKPLPLHCGIDPAESLGNADMGDGIAAETHSVGKSTHALRNTCFPFGSKIRSDSECVALPMGKGSAFVWKLVSLLKHLKGSALGRWCESLPKAAIHAQSVCDWKRESKGIRISRMILPAERVKVTLAGTEFANHLKGSKHANQLIDESFARFRHAVSEWCRNFVTTRWQNHCLCGNRTFSVSCGQPVENQSPEIKSRTFKARQGFNLSRNRFPTGTATVDWRMK